MPRIEARWIRRAMLGSEPTVGTGLGELASLDLDVVEALAEAHHVTPWLMAVLGGAAEPAVAVGRIRERAVAQTAVALAHERELTRLLHGLAEEGAPAIVLKGPALARQYYPQPGLRPYGDIDLLVRESAATALETLLLDAGYERVGGGSEQLLHHDHGAFQQIYLHREQRLRVELHLDHLQIGLRPVNMEAIWERAVPIEVRGERALALEQHDLLVHLSVHLHRHGFNRLIWFKDIDLLIRRERLDWARVHALADEQGCLDSVARTLELLEATLETPLPSGARRLIAARPRWSRWLQRLAWPEDETIDLELRRRWRLRRLVQFAPETGLLRGGLPSLLFTGRRRTKLRVLAAARMPGTRRAAPPTTADQERPGPTPKR